jgi:WD40 repeat protein
VLHPSLESIVAGEAAEHVERCPSCRQLAALAGVELAPPVDDLARLTTVDPRVYTEWTPLPEARGGMGALFRVRDRRLGRHVAIKQLRTDLSDQERAVMLARFEREARLTAQLQHPAIVGVHEAGRFTGGEPFYAMPLLRGRPLGAEIAHRPTLAERLGLLANLTTVAEAIAYAHEQRVVHRDIKPDNILVGAFGETIVIDWGLAKDLADDRAEDHAELAPTTDGLTQFGVGTANYMPPEQARGDAPEPSFDVYALGATLYHLLAGVPPYDGEASVDIRRALVARRPPRPLAELVPDVPVELADIVAHAMALDAARRFPSARELAHELRRFQTGQLLASRRYTVGELVRHFLRRHRTALRISALALIAVVAAVVIAVVRIAGERDRATANQLRAERELRRALGLAASSRAGDPQHRLDAILTGLRALAPDLDAGAPPVPEAVQGLTDALVAGPPLVALPHDGVIKWFAAAGDRLIGVDDARAVVVWNAASGAQLARYPSSLGQPERPRVSPDGQRIVVCGFEPAGEVIELATGETRRFEAKANFAGCAFLPDGRLIAAADDVTIRDARTLAVGERFALPAPANALALAPSGRAAVSTLDGTLWTWDPRSKSPPVSTATGLRLGDELAYPRAEDVLYQGGADQIVRAFSPDGSGAPRAVFHDPSWDLALLLPSPASERVAIGLWDVGGGRRSHVLPATSVDGNVVSWAPPWIVVDRFGPLALVDGDTAGTVLPLRAHATEATALAVGDRLASSSRDGAAYLWDLGSPGLLLGHASEIVALEVRGNAILSASLDGSARVWNAGNGAKIALAPGERELTTATWLDDSAFVVGDLAGQVRVHDAATGTVRATLDAGAPISALAAHDGQLAAGTLGGVVVLADQTLATPRRLVATAGAVTALAFTAGGTRLVTSHADGSTRLWDVATGAALAVHADTTPLDRPGDHEGDLALVEYGHDVLAVRPAATTTVLAPGDLATRATLDGRVVATAGPRMIRALPDGTVVLAGAGADRKLTGHRAAVLAAALEDDRLATASADGTVRMWSVAEGTSWLTIDARDLGIPVRVAFAGDALVIGYASGAVRLVPITPAGLRHRACTIARRFGRDVDGYCPLTETSRT